MARCNPCPDCQHRHGRALGRIEELEKAILRRDEAAVDAAAKLHAAEVERDAALFQLHEQNAKLDRAEIVVEALRDL